MKILIDKDVLFDLIASHLKLNQAEYNRNKQYNDSHFAYKAEEAIIAELEDEKLVAELLERIKGDNSHV